MDWLFKDGVCTGAMICELLSQLVLEVSEGDKKLQLPQLLQFDPVFGSRELEGKAAKQKLASGMTNEIYLLERVLWVGAAMVTSELR